MLFLLALVMGINSFLTMPRTETPPIAQPGAVVTVIYPGASPQDMEELVVNKIEEQVYELENIEKVQSTIGDGFALINVSYVYGNYDQDEKFNEVVQQVNGVSMDLPEDIRDITFKKKATTDTKILQLALGSDHLPYDQLEDEAENLKAKLEQVNGIKTVEILAVPDKQVQISMKSDQMLMMGITIDDLSNAIQSNNQNIPGGEVNMGKKSFNIQTSGSYSDLYEIENTVVGSYQGKLVYLKNVAEVDFDFEESRYIAGYNGQRSIFLTAEQKEGLNVLDIIDEAVDIIGAYEKKLPAGIDLNYVHNQAIGVKASINSFLKNLVQGVSLVGLFVMLAIGFRSSLVVIIAIPASILIGLGLLDLSGYGLQNISIAALVIALGLLVDNSIVVVENTERFLKMGLSSREAAIKGTKQIVYPVISSTLTTLAAFIPIAMMQDASGDYMRSLPVTVVCTLVASLVIAITVTPLLLAKLYKRRADKVPHDLPLQKRLRKFIEGPYHKLLTYSLNHSARILIVALVLFLLAIFAGAKFVGVSFFPKAEQAKFLIQVVTPQGSNLNETHRVANYVESVIDTLAEVRHYASNVGHGNPKIYYNSFSRDYARNYAEFFVELEEYDRPQFDRTLEILRNEFDQYPGADIRVKEFSQGIPIQYPVEVVLYGNDLGQLTEISKEFKDIIAGHPGVVNIENKLEGVKTDLFININKDKAALLGVPVSEIDKTVRTCMNGSVISGFRDENGKEYDIVLRLESIGQPVYEDFDRIYVKSYGGGQIPLSQLATIEFKKGPSNITHYNLMRSATLGADVKQGYNVSKVTEELTSELDKYDLPGSFSYYMAGEVETQKKSFGNLGNAALVAVLIIMTILVLQFRSFRQPFIIFTSIPMALIGSALALLITGYSFSFTAFIGAVALIGIVINDSIILIDFTNEIRKEGKSIKEALIEAGQIRFTPILITSITTIGGLLPLTLQGGELWGPLGWTIIGGLLLSTTLILIIVPVLYQSLEKERI